MIIPDVNLLLYGAIDAFPQHEKTRRWWEQAVNSDEIIGLADLAAFGFLRISTNPRLIKPPLTIDDATARVKEWLAQPNITRVLPGPKHLSLTFGFLHAAGTASNLTTDAQLAAIAIENDAAIYSSDSDFARFKGVEWVNPLA